MKYLLLLFLVSCGSVDVHDRELIHYSDVINNKTFVCSDTEFESIELSEIQGYRFDCKRMLEDEGITYEENQFDCEDYTRQLIAYIMREHKYKKTPALSSVIIPRHSLMGFYNNKKDFIMIDASTGVVYVGEYLMRMF